VAVGDRRGLERLQVDVQQIDERAVLLMGDVAAVEDLSLVDADVRFDPAQCERAGETVRVGVV